MTIFFPDVSHYDIDRGVTLEQGTVAVIVKATHGTEFLDSGFYHYMNQAARIGAHFVAYHWLNHGNGAAQARYCFEYVGRVSVMIDAEDMPNNTGYNGRITVRDILDFATELRAAGGTCHLVYLPHWYWEGMGSPDLTPLRDAGLSLVSSNYRAYSDTGAGWDAYGGVRPVQWQYTDALPYGGGSSDFNAFRGTLDEYKALTMGTKMADYGPLGNPKNYPYPPDAAAVDVQTALRTGDKTGWSDTDGAGWFVTKKLRSVEAQSQSNGSTLSVLRSDIAALSAKVDGIAVGGVDLDALATKVADTLAARLGNG